MEFAFYLCNELKRYLMILKKRVTLLALLALMGCGAAVCVSRAQTNAPAKTVNPSAWALSDTNQSTPIPPANSSTSEAVKTLMISIVVLIVIGTAAIYAAKKWLPKIGLAKGRHIAVMESVQLAPNRAVHLIQVGSQRFLLGSSNESVRMLADVTLALLDESAGKESAQTDHRSV
jgi:flagellar biogenesis protein FliO